VHLLTQIAGGRAHAAGDVSGADDLIFVRAIHKFMPADIDLIVIAQEMFDDRVAIDQRAVGAAEIFEERIGEYGDHCCVLAADREIRQADIVVGAAADGDALVIQRDVQRGAILEVEYQLAPQGLIPSFPLIL